MAVNLKGQSSQIFMFLIVLLIAVGLVYFVLLKPMNDQIDEIIQQNLALQAQIDQMQAVERKISQYGREIEAQKRQLDELKAALPDEKETADIIRRIQEFAVASNIRLKSFRPQATIDQEFYTEWPIKLELDGSYHNLGSFFEKLSRHSRIINVRDIDMKRIPDSLDLSRTLTASCTSTTFVYK